MAVQVEDVLDRCTQWLKNFGETSFDHQSFFAGPLGSRAKALYYRQKLIGTAAVAPMIFFEAFLPSARRLFHQRTRFPIADAHYAMGFAFLYEATGDVSCLDRAVHFLDELEKSRCSGFKEFCWGYPFDWVTRTGTIKQQTPLITTTPYVYEAFMQVSEACRKGPQDQKAEQGGGRRRQSGKGIGNDDGGHPAQNPMSEGGVGLSPGGGQEEVFAPSLRAKWRQIMESIARHATTDIKDFPASPTGNTCSYTPYDTGGVLNASAYRAGMLTSASRVFDNEGYWQIAERNLNFVLENQNADGSWHYATDGVRDFVDHFHTCFVMKALAKIHALTGHEATFAALKRGVKYYLENLFDEDGLPKPFSKAPRLTVYKRELYDCAECINLCLLLRGRFPELEATLETVVAGILQDWVKPDGSFRARQLKFGWDNVPMHRWAQSQMFRSLAFYLREATKAEDGGRRTEG